MKCIWCSREIKDCHGNECDSCWELRQRIEANPALAERMIRATVRKMIKEIRGENIRGAKR